MSRVYFHTPERTVGIGGRQRAAFGTLCTRLADGIYNFDGVFGEERLAPFRRMLKPDHYAHSAKDEREFAMRVSTLLHITDDSFRWNGHSLSTFALGLNTALVLGSDAVKLGARIHGACEIHTWVDGLNRAWLAGIIGQGLEDGVYMKSIEQPPYEWRDVIDLLLWRDYEPVVLSYSVCEQFPSASLALGLDTHFDEEAREAFYNKSPREQWDAAMAALKAQEGGLELRPDDWREFRFDHRLSALDFVADDWEARLDAVFPRSEAA
jgi:hypothetical protein